MDDRHIHDIGVGPVRHGLRQLDGQPLSAGGGSVLFMALLNLILSSRAVAPVVTIVSLIAGPVRMAVFRGEINWRVVAWQSLGGVAGAVLGGWLPGQVSAGWLDLLVASFLRSTA
jgi:uncharacterized protein